MEEFTSLVDSAVVSGIIGLVAPFLLPFVFKLFKRELSKEEKRTLITVIALAVSITVLGIRWDWSGNFADCLLNFLTYLFVNFVAVKGMVQTVYELIVKGIPEIDQKLSNI